MKLKQIYEAADKLAPFALSEEYVTRLGYHDNSGVILDCGDEIEGILFSLDLSRAAVEAAKRAHANCIFTHHPAIWNGVMKLEEGRGADGVVACVRERISVISAHLNLDAAPGGIDEWLMRGLGGNKPIASWEQLTGGCYGRVYDTQRRTVGEFVAHIKKEFSTDRVIAYGSAPVGRIASFCGGGFEERSLAFAVEQGADTLVSSDGKHHLLASALEQGLNVVLLTHYASENYGFLRFAEKMKETLGAKVSTETFTDAALL